MNDDYNPEMHIGDTMEDNCISLRTFILGEIKVFERPYSPRYEVVFFPNSWAWHNGLKHESYNYYERNDAMTCKDALKQKYINMFIRSK